VMAVGTASDQKHASYCILRVSNQLGNHIMPKEYLFLIFVLFC
jgi:hypothetical protein